MLLYIDPKMNMNFMLIYYLVAIVYSLVYRLYTITMFHIYGFKDLKNVPGNTYFASFIEQNVSAYIIKSF